MSRRTGAPTDARGGWLFASEWPPGDTRGERQGDCQSERNGGENGAPILPASARVSELLEPAPIRSVAEHGSD